ncbi:MAG: hypothetical protein QOJ47_788, partial [Gaiellales bacterium]|nr:hypothetical protein [Gaiellales bacterium]
DALAWLPGTMNVSKLTSRRLIATALSSDTPERLDFTATRSGSWPIEVVATEGWTSYRLSWSIGPSSSLGGTSLR